MMKKLLLPLAAALVTLLTTTSATAGQKYVSAPYPAGRTACGCPVYNQQYIAGFNRFGHPVYRQRSLPVRHRCQPVVQPPRHRHVQAPVCRTPVYPSTPGYRRGPVFVRQAAPVRRCR